MELDLKQKSYTGFKWDLLGKIGLQGVGFAISIFLARLLGPEDFGILAIITVFITFSGAIADFGFSTALVQKDKIEEIHYSSVFIFNIILGAFLALCVFLVAPLIGKFYENELLTIITQVMSISLIINSFGNTTKARLRREMKFKEISISQLIGALISGIIGFYLAWTGYGVWSLVFQSISNSFIAIFALYLLTEYKIRLSFQIEALKELWKVSSRMFYTGFSDLIILNLDALLIGKFLNPAMLGYFYRAKSLEQFGFRYTAGTLSSVLLPGLSALQHQRDKLKNVISKAFHLLSFVSFFLCGFLLVEAREIIILLFSSKWEPSIFIFQILIGGAFASQLYSLFQNVLIATGEVKMVLKINFMGNILFLLSFILLFLGNFYIYLGAYIFIKILVMLISMLSIDKNFNFMGDLFKKGFQYFLISLISVLITFYFKENFSLKGNLTNLFISGTLYTSLFILISFLLRVKGMQFLSKEIKLTSSRLIKQNV